MPPIDPIENPKPPAPDRTAGRLPSSRCIKATAEDSDEATNSVSAVASDTTLGLLARAGFPAKAFAAMMSGNVQSPLGNSEHGENCCNESHTGHAEGRVE